MNTRLLSGKHASGVLLVVLSIFLLSSTSHAEGNIQLGKFKILPYLKYSIKYDDNIYKDNKNEKSDFIHTVTPRIGVLYQGGRPENFLYVDYAVDLVAYDDYSDNNYQTHMPSAKLAFKSGYGFYMNAGNRYKKTWDPYGSLNDFRLGERTKRWNNDTDLTLGYELTHKYAAEVVYRHQVKRYYEPQDKWQERDGDVYGLVFLYNLTPKTSFLAQYRRSDYSFESQNDGVFDPDRGLFWSSSTSQDYSLDDFFLGMRFRPGGKIKGEIKLGYSLMSFDNKYDPNGKKYDDDDSWAAETNVTYSATERAELTLRLRRAYENSSDALDVNNYIDNLVGFKWVQKLAYQLSLNAYLAYQYWDYQNEAPGLSGKSFDIYTAQIGLDWAINEWLKTGLSYRYKTKDASKKIFESDEYTENVTMVYVEGRY